MLHTDFDTMNTVYKPVTEDEWTKVVKKSKRTSTSSMFSKRTYPTYKCALGSPRLTKLLLRCLNLTINNRHILNRWLQIVDVMLEKGKDNVLGKLHTIQIVEGDLQLLMRVLITLRNSERAERSDRLSCFNFGNRRNYDIQTAILEKQVIKDTANTLHLPIIHYLDDRQACYDRQLPNLGLLAERSFGLHEKEAHILCKILQKFRHHL